MSRRNLHRHFTTIDTGTNIKNDSLMRYTFLTPGTLLTQTQTMRRKVKKYCKGNNINKQQWIEQIEENR